MENQKIGSEGESGAREYLKKKGYKIIESNYLKRSGEIDIIAFDPEFNEYVFVEVKTRKNNYFGYPEEFVDERKMEKIVSVANQWLKTQLAEEVDWRIDIIGITGEKGSFEFHHLKNL